MSPSVNELRVEALAGALPNPHDAEAELAIVGCPLITPSILDDPSCQVPTDAFYSEAGAITWAAMLALHAKGCEPSVKALSDSLRASGDYETIGGIAYLLGAIEAVGSTALAPHYATRIRQTAKLRRIGQVGLDLHVEAFTERDPERADNLHASAERRIAAIADQEQIAEATTIANSVEKTFSQIAARAAGEMPAHGLECGLIDVDRLTNGFHPCELVVIAARPGVGKSALALSIAKHQSAKGHGVAFFSLEMSEHDLICRLLAQQSCVNAQQIRHGRLDRIQLDRVGEAAAWAESLPLFVDDRPFITTSEIARTTRQLKRKHRIDLLIVDYLQLVQPADRRLPRHESVGAMTRDLKLLAKTLEIPLVILAQLNREADSKRPSRKQPSDDRPKLSQLRESGSIEQDADMVLFIHRPTPPKGDSPGPCVEVIVAKNRSGPCGVAEVVWHGETQRFLDAAPDYRRDDEWNDCEL